MYVMSLAKILMSHSIDYHKFADDQQLITFFDLTVVGDLDVERGRLKSCVHQISVWMSITKVLLKPVKTAFLVLMSPHHLAAYECPVLTLGNLTIAPSDFIRNLRCVFDGRMRMETFVIAICAKCSFPLRKIGSICPHLSTEVCHSSVISLGLLLQYLVWLLRAICILCRRSLDIGTMHKQYTT